MNSAAPIKFYATVTQGMFQTSFYSDLGGEEVRFDGSGTVAEEGGYALSFKPWHLQVQEQGADGVWRMVHTSEGFMRKDQAIADAERQGIALDYVSHHKDYVKGWLLGRAAGR
jgi:hypothetical protein